MMEKKFNYLPPRATTRQVTIDRSFVTSNTQYAGAGIADTDATYQDFNWED